MPCRLLLPVAIKPNGLPFRHLLQYRVHRDGHMLGRLVLSNLFQNIFLFSTQLLPIWFHESIALPSGLLLLQLLLQDALCERQLLSCQLYCREPMPGGLLLLHTSQQDHVRCPVLLSKRQPQPNFVPCGERLSDPFQKHAMRTVAVLSRWHHRRRPVPGQILLPRPVHCDSVPRRLLLPCGLRSPDSLLGRTLLPHPGEQGPL